MNYREKMRNAIACPQFGDETYGEWGTLNLTQRRYIKRLLNELDSADNCIKRVYLENKELEQQCKKQKEVIDKVIQLLEDNNICADIRRLKPKWNENKYGVEYELLDILKEVENG